LGINNAIVAANIRKYFQTRLSILVVAINFDKNSSYVCRISAYVFTFYQFCKLIKISIEV